METLFVALGSRSYPIHFAPAAEWQPELAKLLGSRPVLLVTDENVARCGHAARIAERLPRCASCVLPPGEAGKTLAAVERICRAGVAAGLDRHGVMIAVGGGVVGDLTGLASAIYMRGIDFVQIPTTLLAAVDSSVGGKTGADLPEGKNLIGAFHQPRMVLVDMANLSTLPEAEWRNGLAETVKYGFIMDADFLAMLEANTEKLNAFDPDFYAGVIRRSCLCKADVVAADECEKGRRAILNYGHTAAHAVEKLSDFAIPHGLAVAMGMAAAARVAVEFGYCPAAFEKRQNALLAKLSLPVSIPRRFAAADLVEAMRGDKKNAGGRITMVLPRAAGAVEIFNGMDERRLAAALDGVRA